jgi:hypothetical protein
VVARQLSEGWFWWSGSGNGELRSRFANLCTWVGGAFTQSPNVSWLPGGLPAAWIQWRHLLNAIRGELRLQQRRAACGCWQLVCTPKMLPVQSQSAARPTLRLLLALLLPLLLRLLSLLLPLSLLLRLLSLPVPAAAAPDVTAAAHRRCPLPMPLLLQLQLFSLPMPLPLLLRLF